jgi:hypothetical protein
VSDPTENPVTGPTDRYGGGRQRRALPIVLGTLVALTLLAWAVWAGFTSQPAIDAQLTSYDVVSTHEVRVKISAQFRDADTTGSCLVRATAEDHTVVGELNLTADELRAAKGRWISVRTERRATTATLVRCTG